MVLVPPRFEVDRFQEVVSAVSSGDGQRVRFSGIADLGDASIVVGARVLASERDLPADGEPQGPEAWVGLTAVDETWGELGTVRAVEEGPSQALLVIDRDGREVLVPAVAPILLSVDEAAVHLACPAGLLDL